MIVGVGAARWWLCGAALFVGSVPARLPAVECDLVLCGKQGAIRAQLSVVQQDRPLAEMLDAAHGATTG